MAPAVKALVEAGMLVEGKSIRLPPAGRERLDHLLTEERHGIDGAAIANAYNDFRSVNADFKALVSDWQLKDGEPNNHDDAEYDAAVLGRLDRVHEAVLPIVAAVAAVLPRLNAYVDKLSAAIQKIEDKSREYNVVHPTHHRLVPHGVDPRGGG